MITFLEKTPEEKGISSKALLRFIKKLDEKKIPMHSLLIARGEDVILNAYWAPFTKDTLHRQNSVTKSFVSLAIGLLEEEGKLKLSDRIIKFFPEIDETDVVPEVRALTIYDLLTMRTVSIVGIGGHWVRDKKYNRIKDYFNLKPEKTAESFFDYDSHGSYMLGVIAERLAGKPFMEYLKEKILLKIGFSENTTCIRGTEGYSWSDSGLLCTAEDLYRTGKFINQGGVWEGERLMNEEYLKKATSFITSNCVAGNDVDNNAHGYGYQIWHEILDGFGFHGMGLQYMLCIPKLDFYLVCNADTQGYDNARAIFLSMYEDFVKEEVLDAPLPENSEAYAELMRYCENLKLISLGGFASSDVCADINGKIYTLGENKMGIKWVRLNLDGECGELIYENAQGVKRLAFGVCKNLITEFPEDGYADMQIGESPLGYHHPCAVSGAWLDGRVFGIKAQMVGKHLGGLFIRLGFSGDTVSITMTKNTNCFLNEYNGCAVGKRNA